MKQISDFDSFNHHHFMITADMDSAQYTPQDGIITIQGVAVRRTKEYIPVEIRLDPQNTTGFDTSLSASNGEFTDYDFQKKATLQSIVRLDSGSEL
jgi:hypothetical protein